MPRSQRVVHIQGGRFYSEYPAPGHGIPCVRDKVKERLVDLRPISHDHGVLVGQ